jgi:hypothetical protein
LQFIKQLLPLRTQLLHPWQAVACQQRQQLCQQLVGWSHGVVPKLLLLLLLLLGFLLLLQQR